MATKQQVSWSNGREALPLKIKIKNQKLFFKACAMRANLGFFGGSKKQWLELASMFQEAKGEGQSFCADWCMVQAKKAGVQ